MNELIDQILQNANLTQACFEVIRNKGAGGVDGMSVKELKSYLDKNRQALVEQVRNCDYHAQPIRGKEIPKGKDKIRLLGIPTVIDRMLQQAVLRVIMPRYEFNFSSYSYGFRPKRNIIQATSKALNYVNSGYQHIVEIDLKQFFDRVDHTILLQLLYRKIKCKATMCLIRRWLRAPLLKDGKLIKRRIGVPQGSPISPLLANIMLHEMDIEMDRRNLHFVRYADDFSIYCKTKTEAQKAGNGIYLFLRDKLKLPINREKSGVRRPVNFQILGFGFVPIYKKGVKGKYQLVITTKKWDKFKSDLKEITRKTLPMSFDERIQKLNNTINGWIESRKYANIKTKLAALDGWIRNRLRGCIWSRVLGRKNRREKGKTLSDSGSILIWHMRGAGLIWADGLSPKARYLELPSPSIGLKEEATYQCPRSMKRKPLNLLIPHCFPCFKEPPYTACPDCFIGKTRTYGGVRASPIGF